MSSGLEEDAPQPFTSPSRRSLCTPRLEVARCARFPPRQGHTVNRQRAFIRLKKVFVVCLFIYVFID